MWLIFALRSTWFWKDEKGRYQPHDEVIAQRLEDVRPGTPFVRTNNRRPGFPDPSEPFFDDGYFLFNFSPFC